MAYQREDGDWYDVWNNMADEPAPYVAPPQGPPVTWGSMNPAPNVPGGWSDAHTGGFVPANSNAPSGTQDLSYWASRGVPADQIFDFATGQPRAGWQRTDKGYGPVTPPRTETRREDPLDPLPTTYGTLGDMAGGGGRRVSPVPGFSAPRYRSPGPFTWNKPAAFVAPDKEAVLKDPGFQIRMEYGQKAIENAASAKGQSRTGATWKGLIDYAGQQASQEYGQAYNRSASEYDRTYRNAFEDAVTAYGFLADDRQREFTNDLAATSAEYAPSFAEWSAQNDLDTFGLGLVADLLKEVYRGGKPG